MELPTTEDFGSQKVRRRNDDEPGGVRWGLLTRFDGWSDFFSCFGRVDELGVEFFGRVLREVLFVVQ